MASSAHHNAVMHGSLHGVSAALVSCMPTAKVWPRTTWLQHGGTTVQAGCGPEQCTCPVQPRLHGNGVPQDATKAAQFKDTTQQKQALKHQHRPCQTATSTPTGRLRLCAIVSRIKTTILFTKLKEANLQHNSASHTNDSRFNMRVVDDDGAEAEAGKLLLLVPVLLLVLVVIGGSAPTEWGLTLALLLLVAVAAGIAVGVGLRLTVVVAVAVGLRSVTVAVSVGVGGGTVTVAVGVTVGVGVGGGGGVIVLPSSIPGGLHSVVWLLGVAVDVSVSVVVAVAIGVGVGVGVWLLGVGIDVSASCMAEEEDAESILTDATLHEPPYEPAASTCPSRLRINMKHKP